MSKREELKEFIGGMIIFGFPIVLICLGLMK